MAWSNTTMPWVCRHRKKCPQNGLPPVHATCTSARRPLPGRKGHDDLERRAGCELRRRLFSRGTVRSATVPFERRG